MNEEIKKIKSKYETKKNIAWNLIKQQKLNRTLRSILKMVSAHLNKVIDKNDIQVAISYLKKAII